MGIKIKWTCQIGFHIINLLFEKNNVKIQPPNDDPLTPVTSVTFGALA